MDFDGASAYILGRLNHELNPSLQYHSAGHTLDVLEAARRLTVSEGIDDEGSMLVHTAALFHDAGMMLQYRDHESTSAQLAREVLPRFGYSDEQIDTIASLILVTRLPQRALTPLEQIICDADLDYLGRDDFFIGSFKLRLEWETNNIGHYSLTEWFRLQVRFLSEHQYFTTSAKVTRQKKKEENLQQIMKHLSPPIQ